MKLDMIHGLKRSQIFRKNSSKYLPVHEILVLIALSNNNFMEIDHEIIFMVILLPSSETFKKGCCQLQAKVCARSTG